MQNRTPASCSFAAAANGASYGSPLSRGRLITGPRITGTSRFFSSSATFHASMPPLRIDLQLQFVGQLERVEDVGLAVGRG